MVRLAVLVVDLAHGSHWGVDRVEEGAVAGVKSPSRCRARITHLILGSDGIGFMYCFIVVSKVELSRFSVKSILPVLSVQDSRCSRPFESNCIT